MILEDLEYVLGVFFTPRGYTTPPCRICQQFFRFYVSGRMLRRASTAKKEQASASATSSIRFASEL